MSELTPPPGINLAANEGPRVVSSGIALIVLPTIFVILRFTSRVWVRAGFWVRHTRAVQVATVANKAPQWDDLLLVFSLLFSYGPNIAMMISAQSNGFGRHLWALKDPAHNTSEFLLILYIYIIFYYCAVVSVKLCM